MAGSSHMRELDSDLLILNERLKSYINEGMDNTMNVAQNVADYCKDNEKRKEEMKDIMKSFIEMEREVGQYAEALNHVKSVVLNSGDVEPEGYSALYNVFTEKLKQIQAGKHHSIKDHPKYVQLETQLADTGSIEEQLEHLRAKLGGATEDEDVAMTSVEINTKCPITGQTMVVPVLNKVCNHVYDRDGILSYINSRKAKANVRTDDISRLANQISHYSGSLLDTDSNDTEDWIVVHISVTIGNIGHLHGHSLQN